METFSALLAICAVNSPHKCQWGGALMFSFICVRIHGWANSREAGVLRRYHSHYDVTVMNYPRTNCIWNTYTIHIKSIQITLEIPSNLWLWIFIWVHVDQPNVSRSSEDTMTWKHHENYWHFVRVILRPTDSPHEGQLYAALMFCC